MRSTRHFLPGAALLALTIVLAGCGRAVADPGSPTVPPSVAPSPTDTPSVEPSPSEAPAPTQQPTPTASPSSSPSPSPIEVIEHELPMIGRSTTDGVEIRTLPDLDAPLIVGERFGDGGQAQDVPDLRLSTDDRVVVTLGPVYADGESWYEVSAADGAEVWFAGGWVPGQYLSREGELPEPIIVDIYGLGSGTAASHDVPLHGTPATVRFAATPMPDRDACEIEVTLIRTDGTAVNVATESLTEPMVAELSANELSSLFQEEAGKVTLQVRTDCSYAATLTLPPV